MATFSSWLSVDQLQIPDEQVSWCIADWRSKPSSTPPNTNRSPLISRIEKPDNFFGNGGPNVGKKKKIMKTQFFHDTPLS